MKTFLYTRITGDWNVATYSKSRKQSTKNTLCEQWFFTPHPDADPARVKAEMKRGFTFFTVKEGFLFGAQVELAKLGTLTKQAA